MPTPEEERDATREQLRRLEKSHRELEKAYRGLQWQHAQLHATHTAVCVELCEARDRLFEDKPPAGPAILW